MGTSFAAAADIGATNQRVAIVRDDGKIVARGAAPLEPDPSSVLAAVARTILDLSAQHGVRVSAAGVSLPAPVDVVRGRTITQFPDAPIDWDGTAIPDGLGAALAVQVVVENDGNAAAIGEGWIGAARGLNDFVFIAVGTAIGAGIVIGGQIHRGASNLAGEVSIFPMRRSALETQSWDDVLGLVAGGTAADVKAKTLFGDDSSAADLFARAKKGSVEAAAFVREMQEYLAMAVAYTAALLDPDVIVFGGGVAAAQGEWFLDPIRELSARFMPGRPDIRLSMLGPNAQLLGAARLAFDAVNLPAS